MHANNMWDPTQGTTLCANGVEAMSASHDPATPPWRFARKGCISQVRMPIDIIEVVPHGATVGARHGAAAASAHTKQWARLSGRSHVPAKGARARLQSTSWCQCPRPAAAPWAHRGAHLACADNMFHNDQLWLQRHRRAPVM